MTAYYNEIDPYAAQWLRNLIAAGHIAPGDVDERSILDVKPDDLKSYTQCHWFAGVGVWSLALRRSGWPDDSPVWTGSCPCQPFSAAGKGDGFTDERHLWPAFFHLITQCKPDRIYGEQVASKDGLGWLDLVQADLEGAGYASGAVDTCSASFGSPHIRQRLWFVAERMADSSSERSQEQWREWNEPEGFAEDGISCGVADSNLEPAGRNGRGSHCTENEVNEQGTRDNNGLEDDGGDLRPGPTNGLWADADWLHCRDGKWRPVEPGTFPLASRTSNRVGKLRAYGNCINVEAAQAFIEATMTTDDLPPSAGEIAK